MDFDNLYYKEQNKMIKIMEEFDKWLTNMSNRVNMDKDDIQQLIKGLLQ